MLNLGTAAMRKPKAPAANRAHILKAATDEFAARGFKGASMDAIAARTLTTRALINYYFGSKEKLYVAVLEQMYSGIRDAESTLDLDHLPPVDAVRRIVEFTYNYYVEHVDFVRIVVAENQAQGRHLRKSKLMRTLNWPIIDRLGRVIDRGRSLVREMPKNSEDVRSNTLQQLYILSRRAGLLQQAIVFAVICVLLAAVLVITLFFTAAFKMENAWLIGILFVGAMGSLIISLIAFLQELNQSLIAYRLDVGEGLK